DGVALLDARAECIYCFDSWCHSLASLEKIFSLALMKVFGIIVKELMIVFCVLVNFVHSLQAGHNIFVRTDLQD
ncbi:MAG TPA: hypothetical protein VK206_23125, partial [Anaerolineales bacterium]|nr:hypothetical protein [Anaerolineales bacterium]